MDARKLSDYRRRLETRREELIADGPKKIEPAWAGAPADSDHPATTIPNSQ